jgi:hypothetical protein
MYIINNDDLKYSDIMNLHGYFSTTSYGEISANKLRYKLYKPESFSTEAWMEALGLDGNVLDHALKNYHIAEIFLSECNYPSPFWPIDRSDEAIFSAYEQKLILLACIIHDWAESVNGDKPYILKTEEDESSEMKTARLVCEGVFADYKNKYLLNFVNIALEDVVINKQSKLGNAFSVVEKIGYLQTAINTWRYGLGISEFKLNFFTISVSVFMHFVPTLIEAAKIYPGAYSYLVKNKKEINEIKKIDAGIINFHPKDKPLYLIEAVKKWDEFYKKSNKRELTLNGNIEIP